MRLDATRVVDGRRLQRRMRQFLDAEHRLLAYTSGSTSKPKNSTTAGYLVGDSTAKLVFDFQSDDIFGVPQILGDHGHSYALYELCEWRDDVDVRGIT